MPENTGRQPGVAYLMLAAVAGSIVLGGGAIVDLARRLGRRTECDQ